MMLQNHILVGYVIAKTITNPWIGIPLAFSSHFFLDLFPYPSKEMEITLQDSLISQRDKVTFSFIISQMVVLSIFIIGMIFYNRQFDWYTLVVLIVAIINDIYFQIIPIIRNKRKSIYDEHKIILCKNPYIQIIIHQITTILGLVFLILY